MMENLMTRFLSKINKIENGCWIWNGSKVAGYGAFRNGNKIEKAHRMSYMIFKGEIPVVNNVKRSYTLIRHTCDNGLCVNPDHLLPGTDQDNVNDRDSRKRFKKLLGEENGMSKLTSNDVSDIRVLKGFGLKISQIAKEYSVSKSSIERILNLSSWKHV